MAFDVMMQWNSFEFLENISVFIAKLTIVTIVQHVRTPWVLFGCSYTYWKFLENKPQMIFMPMFSGTEHKYIIQVSGTCVDTRIQQATPIAVESWWL